VKEFEGGEINVLYASGGSEPEEWRRKVHGSVSFDVGD
jgi:hypothetical protein